MILRHSFCCSFGTEPREKKSILPALTPGPTYMPNTDLSSTHHNSPRATIGKAPRLSSISQTAAAPDADITLPPLETISRHSYRATFGTAKRTKEKEERTPGPGDYSDPVGLIFLLLLLFTYIYVFFFI